MTLPKELTTVTPLSKILASILFISLPFIGYFLGVRYQEMLNLAKSQENEVFRTPTPTIDPITNWKTYTNTLYEYSIDYPSNASYEELTIPNIHNKDKKEIKTVFTVNGGSLEIEGNGAGMGVSPINRKETIIDRIQTTKFYIEETRGVIKAIDSPKGDEIFFSFTLPSSPQDAKAVDFLVDQMLSTFKFTNQTSDEGKFCGGIAGIPCPSGYECKLDGAYPDAGGKCMKLAL